MFRRVKRFQCLVFLFVIAAIALPLNAQSTIYNTPSADTLSRGSFYLEADFATKPVRFRSNGYRTWGYRAVYGLNHKTEVGANFFFTRSSGELIGELQFNVKRKLYTSEKRGIGVSAGTMLYIPLKSFSNARKNALTYTNVSKTFKKLRGLKTTVGFYRVLGGGKEYGTKTGMLAGIEKQVTKRIMFFADWYSGKNRLGYSAAGFTYNLTKRSFFSVAYNFGNYGAGNNALSMLYAYTF